MARKKTRENKLTLIVYVGLYLLHLALTKM